MPCCTDISSVGVCTLINCRSRANFPGCECCQGYLCARECKNDAGRICLEPAVRDYGATVLDECEVTHVEATWIAVYGRRVPVAGWDVDLRAIRIALAAGALMTPALMLRSASSKWPREGSRTGRVWSAATSCATASIYT